jgi:hypothetical protein
LSLGAAGEVPVERTVGAAENLGVGGFLGDRQHVAVDAVAGDVAVPEVDRERQPVIGVRDSQHSSEGLLPLLSTGTIGPMSRLPSSSILPRATPSAEA